MEGFSLSIRDIDDVEDIGGIGDVNEERVQIYHVRSEAQRRVHAQLENMDRITRQREHIYNLYLELLGPLAERGILRLPIIPEGRTSNYHMLYIITEDAQVQQGLLKQLNERGVNAVFHYVPLHTSPMGESLGYRKGMLPVTEDLSARLIRLPFYFELDDGSIHRIAGEINAYFDGV